MIYPVPLGSRAADILLPFAHELIFKQTYPLIVMQMQPYAIFAGAFSKLFTWNVPISEVFVTVNSF